MPAAHGPRMSRKAKRLKQAERFRRHGDALRTDDPESARIYYEVAIGLYHEARAGFEQAVGFWTVLSRLCACAAIITLSLLFWAFLFSFVGLGPLA